MSYITRPEEYLSGKDLQEFRQEMDFLNTIDILGEYIENGISVREIMEAIEDNETDNYVQFLKDRVDGKTKIIYNDDNIIFNQIGEYEFLDYLHERYDRDFKVFVQEEVIQHVHFQPIEESAEGALSLLDDLLKFQEDNKEE